MRKLFDVIIVILFMGVLFISSCGKHKSSPTRPEDQGFAVTLRYQNYVIYGGYYWYCIRLTMSDNPINKCGLGDVSGSLWNRSYNWKVYAVNSTVTPEVLYQIGAGTVTLDQNRTCTVNGNTITWQ